MGWKYECTQHSWSLVSERLRMSLEEPCSWKRWLGLEGCEATWSQEGRPLWPTQRFKKPSGLKDAAMQPHGGGAGGAAGLRKESGPPASSPVQGATARQHAERQHGGGRPAPSGIRSSPSPPEHPKKLEAPPHKLGRAGQPRAGKQGRARRGTSGAWRGGVVTAGWGPGIFPGGSGCRARRWVQEGARPGVFCSLPTLESPRPWRNSGWDFHGYHDSPPPPHPGSKPPSSWPGLGLPERAFSQGWGPRPPLSLPGEGRVPTIRHGRRVSHSLQTPGVGTCLPISPQD